MGIKDFTQAQSGAPATAGTDWTYVGTDANTEVKMPGQDDQPVGPSYAQVTKINDDGSIDITTTDGQHTTLKTFNGKPVTSRTLVSKAHKQMTGVDRMGKPTYTQIPDQYRYTLNADALPKLRSDTNGPNGSKVQWFDFAPAGTKKVDKPKSKIGDVIKSYAREAGSSKPEDQADFKQLQDDLYAGGFTGGKKLTAGVYDQATEDALDAALSAASASDVTLDDVLAKGKAANPNGPTTDTTGNALVVTDAKDIKEQVRKHATSVLGYQPDQGFIDGITHEYNSIEAAGQQAKVNATAPGTGGTSTVISGPPDLGTFVEGKLRQSDPIGAQNNTLGNLFGEFMNLLGGGSASFTGGQTNG